MAVRLITYDLNRTGQNYDGFMKVIKNYTWARLSESSYAVDTSDTPEMIYKKLEPYVDSNDYVVVITLEANWWAYHTQEILDWLREHL